MSKGGGSSTTVNKVDPQVMAMLTENYNSARGVANQPFQAYTGERVAGPTATQTQARGLLTGIANDNVGSRSMGAAQAGAQGLMGFTPRSVTGGGYSPVQTQTAQASSFNPVTAARGNVATVDPAQGSGFTPATTARAATSTIDPAQVADFTRAGVSRGSTTNAGFSTIAPAQAGSADQASAASVNRGDVRNVNAGLLSGTDLSAYLNPHTQNVVDASLADLERSRKIAQVSNGDAARSAKAFGGDRQAVLESLTNGEFSRTAASTAANLRSQGYENAQGAAMADLNRQLSADSTNQGVDLSVATTNAGLLQGTELANVAARNNRAEYDTGLRQQGLLANQGAENTAALFNAGAANDMERFNVGSANEAERFNAASANDLSQFNTGLRQQGLLANQVAENDTSRFNAGAENDMARFNTSTAQDADQFNTGLRQQGLLANAGAANDMERFNVGSENDLSRFNAASQQQGDQFNASLRQQGLLADSESANRALEFGASQGFAAQTANQSADIAGAGVRQSAAGLLGNLSGQELGQALSRAGALTSAGEAEQGEQQAMNDAEYEEFLRRIGYPAQQQAIRNAAIGLMPQPTTQTSSQRQSGAQTAGNVLQAGASLAMMFGMSDARLKEDVETTNHDAKGRRWVNFRYLWDRPGTKRHGVIAQEVMKTDPMAVAVHPSGYLMVDYAQLGA